MWAAPSGGADVDHSASNDLTKEISHRSVQQLRYQLVSGQPRVAIRMCMWLGGTSITHVGLMVALIPLRGIWELNSGCQGRAVSAFLH